jgi:molecular chaperone GrpE
MGIGDKQNPNDIEDKILKGMDKMNEENEEYLDDAPEAEPNVQPDEIDPLAALNSENQSLSDENKGLKDRLLRSIAEMENLRKRTEREVQKASSSAIANFARDMLGATDNLSRALMVVPKEERESGNPTLKSLIDGIEMTEREMQRLMQKNGIQSILSLGEIFDPHKHQAMFEVPNTGKPDGTIVEVMQEGFVIGDRILRPAMVGIAKNIGEPAFVETEEEDFPAQNGEPVDKQV